MAIIDNIQFKRAFNYRGTLSQALDAIKNNLKPKLMPGEPLMCSYLEDGAIKYFLAIGIDGKRIQVFPTFDTVGEFAEFIRKCSGNDLTLIISEDSDFTVSTDADGKYIFKMKDNLLTNFS